MTGENGPSRFRCSGKRGNGRVRKLGRLCDFRKKEERVASFHSGKDEK